MDASSDARRNPSASKPDSDSTNRTSAAVKSGRPAERSRVSAPHVPVPSRQTARNSSAKPLGSRSSRCRTLRARSPWVASLRLAAGRGDRASWVNLL